MGTAVCRGENAAVEAARQAISCPMLEDTRIAGSRSVLINITGSPASLGLHETSEACKIIGDATECDDVQISFGVIFNESMEDAVKVTVIATGFQPESAPVAIRPAARSFFDEPAAPAPEPEPEPVAEPVFAEPQPEPVAGAAEPEPEPVLDMDDLDTPAYLRQGRLLN